MLQYFADIFFVSYEKFVEMRSVGKKKTRFFGSILDGLPRVQHFQNSMPADGVKFSLSLSSTYKIIPNYKNSRRL